jgi:hypothetical protein
MTKVTILIAYQEGTLDMITTCLSALDKHTAEPYNLLLVTKNEGSGREELLTLKERFGIQERDIYLVPNTAPLLAGRTHGAMIDEALGAVETEYLLTLDSDCFPVADNWLTELLAMMQPDVACAGILHPWEPPPEDLSKNSIEWRVRSQHCWETTHVACQLVRTDFVRENKLSYALGDDTGLLVPKKAKEMGMKVVGWKPTRCAKPKGTDLDAEFNRYVCVIWGDMVYHHGGYTRKSVLEEEKTFNESFGWVQPLILEKEGAEFLFEEDNSYRYEFDKEDLVAKEKMQRLFGLKQDRMSG